MLKLSFTSILIFVLILVQTTVAVAYVGTRRSKISSIKINNLVTPYRHNLTLGQTLLRMFSTSGMAKIIFFNILILNIFQDLSFGVWGSFREKIISIV